MQSFVVSRQVLSYFFCLSFVNSFLWCDLQLSMCWYFEMVRRCTFHLIHFFMFTSVLYNLRKVWKTGVTWNQNWEEVCRDPQFIFWHKRDSWPKREKEKKKVSLRGYKWKRSIRFSTLFLNIITFTARATTVASAGEETSPYYYVHNILSGGEKEQPCWQQTRGRGMGGNGEGEEGASPYSSRSLGSFTPRRTKPCTSKGRKAWAPTECEGRPRQPDAM